MPQPNRYRQYRMARPRSSGGKSTPAGSGGKSGGRRPAHTPPPPEPLRFRLLRRVLSYVGGPTGQQLGALVLMLAGLLTIVTVAGLNSGRVVNAWARLLVFLFGWGAYPTGALLFALGLLWLRHLTHRPTVWRWRPFVGLELVLVGLLALTQTILRQNGWWLVESGRGGGVVGWAFSVFFSNYLGPLITGVLMALVALLGIGLAFDVTADDLRTFARRLAEVWELQRATREPPSQPVAQVGQGVAISPIPARQRAEGKAQAEEPEIRTASRARAGSVPPAAAEPPPGAPPVTATPPAPVAVAPARTTPATTVPPPARELTLPPLTLLKAPKPVGMDQEEIRRKSRLIEETLSQFGIPAQVTEVRPGPTVTQFGVAPGFIKRGGTEGEEERKVRVSQIASLADDLALALAARSLRVEAPVPGRAVVGIEVPNAEIELVTLRSVLESEEYGRCHKPLCFAVGLDVAGSAVVADLSSMPHLLVAGTTGSGKSVFVKALATSLVMRNRPSELRLVAIDPKLVELTHLNGLPHLLGKAETELERIIRVLRWVAWEMDRRYKLFAAAVARNLDDYNAKAARTLARADVEKAEVELLPRIVVLIDELADLMLSAPEETERTICRIAQMARATGIHLVVATQRPSTDVVTGLIKANFPARVSFATASSVDSRVILDTPGAESLLGRGDMLFLAPDASAPRRVQGCYLSDEELEATVRFWQKEVGATPAAAPWDAMLEARALEPVSPAEAEDADLLEKAIALARSRGAISTSELQRRLRISYNRAALLMEQMEEQGLVGPQESAGRPRRVILGGEEDL